MRDEVALVVVELVVPVVEVLGRSISSAVQKEASASCTFARSVWERQKGMESVCNARCLCMRRTTKETHLVEADGEEDESTAGLDKERLLLLGQVNVADELAVNVIRVSRGIIGGLGGVDDLALGEETGSEKSSSF